MACLKWRQETGERRGARAGRGKRDNGKRRGEARGAGPTGSAGRSGAVGRDGTGTAYLAVRRRERSGAREPRERRERGIRERGYWASAPPSSRDGVPCGSSHESSSS